MTLLRAHMWMTLLLPTPVDLIMSSSFHNDNHPFAFSVFVKKKYLYDIMMKFSIALKCVSLECV